MDVAAFLHQHGMQHAMHIHCSSMRDAITRPEFWPGGLMFFDVRPEVEDLSAQAQATAAQHLAGVERRHLLSNSEICSEGPGSTRRDRFRV